MIDDTSRRDPILDTKILSQWEIDTLLNTLPAEGSPEEGQGRDARPLMARSVKIYDFRRPDKFSKDHMRTLQALHLTFARLLSTSLSSNLRAVVSVKLSSIDQGLYEEYIQQIPSPTVINIISMEPLAGNIILEYNLDVALTIVDRLLGGQGKVLDRPHEITDIEVSLLRGLTAAFLSSIAETWNSVIRTEPVLQDIALNSQMVQVAAPGDVAIIALFEIHIAEHIGAMSICIPYTVLEEVIPKLSAQVWFVSGTRKAATEADRNAIRQQLNRARVVVTGQLGTTDVTARELTEMQVGDVIRLDATATKELDVLVAGQPKFRARPGLRGNRLALRVTQVVEEKEVGEVA